MIDPQYPVAWMSKKKKTISLRVNSKAYELLRNHDFNVSEIANHAIMRAALRVVTEFKGKRKK